MSFGLIQVSYKCLCEYVDDARIGEKGGMQINKTEVLSIVVYVHLWAQRFA